MTQSSPNSPAGPASDTTAPLSQLLESVVSEKELSYWRLQQEILVVAHHDTELIFASLSGPSITTFSDRLASNHAMLSRHLRRHDLPAQEAIMVPAGSYDHAARFADAHGGALTARWEMLLESTVNLAADTFYRDWEAFVAEQPDHAGEIVLQPVKPAERTVIAVAYGQTWVAEGTEDAATDLAKRAIATLPHAAYGLVEVAAGLVTEVDLTFRSWNDTEPPPMARDVAQAIVDGELKDA